MKFSDLEGKTLRVIKADPWEILFEEDNGGMPGGQKFILRPDEPQISNFIPSMELFTLKEERAK